MFTIHALAINPQLILVISAVHILNPAQAHGQNVIDIIGFSSYFCHLLIPNYSSWQLWLLYLKDIIKGPASLLKYVSASSSISDFN